MRLSLHKTGGLGRGALLEHRRQGGRWTGLPAVFVLVMLMILLRGGAVPVWAEQKTGASAPVDAAQAAKAERGPERGAENRPPEPAQKPKSQQPAGRAGRGDIVARVNGIEISRTAFELAESELGTELAGLPQTERHALILEYLVETLLMAQAAEKSSLTEDEKFRQRLEYYRRRALRDMYFEKKVRDSVTDAQVREIYDRQIGRSRPIDEVRVRHILVETRERAEEILKELAKGRNFSTLAQAYSLGPSKVQGGDLGYFSRGQMVKEFEDAAFALEKGKVSEPVKTEFGWHILRVEDRRSSDVPSFETVRDRIRAPLIQQRARQVIQSLKSGAKVEIIDPKLAASLHRSKSAQNAE